METQSSHARLESAGHFVARYGLVLILIWIGGMKFTAFEAEGIKPLVASSPLMFWLLSIFNIQTVSNLLGVTEITAAVMIALRPYSAKLAIVGSAIAVLMFITTLSFLFSLPGWEPSLGGFPALSSAGGFLLKDVVLLGTALWSLGEALSTVESTDSRRIAHPQLPQSAFGR